jgi:hypothetical protein
MNSKDITNIINYENNDDYEAHEEKICWRYGDNREFLAEDTRTVYVRKGETYGGMAIPARAISLKLDAEGIAKAQASHEWIMRRFGK